MTKVLFFEEGQRYQVREHPAQAEQIIAAVNQGQGHRLISWVQPGEELIASRQGDLVIISHCLEAPYQTAISLKPRELQVLHLLSDGNNSAQIALKMGLAPRTVRAYIGNMKELLGAQTIAHLLAKAIAMGLLQPKLVN